MAKRTRAQVAVGDTPTPSELRPKYMTKQEFARRIYRLMLKKGWSQSQLAREASKGGDPQVTRDDVSRYIRGVSLPIEGKLLKLAKVFGVDATDILPNYTATAMDREHPAFEMKVSPANAGVAWLRVNRLVKTSTATAIAAMLEKDETNDDDSA